MLFNLKNKFDMPCWNLIRTQTHSKPCSSVQLMLSSMLNISWTRDKEVVWVTILQNWWTNPSLSINSVKISCSPASALQRINPFFPPWNEATLFHHSGVEWSGDWFYFLLVWFEGKLRQLKSVEQRTFRQLILIQSYSEHPVENGKGGKHIMIKYRNREKMENFTWGWTKGSERVSEGDGWEYNQQQHPHREYSVEFSIRGWQATSTEKQRKFSSFFTHPCASSFSLSSRFQ